MKIFTVIEDGNGIMHFLFSRSPDLVRREHSRLTGAAHIIYCSICSSEIGQREIEKTLQACFKSRRAHAGYDISKREAIVASVWLTQVKPSFLRVAYALRKKTIKPLKGFWRWKLTQVAALKHLIIALK